MNDVEDHDRRVRAYCINCKHALYQFHYNRLFQFNYQCIHQLFWKKVDKSTRTTKTVSKNKHHYWVNFCHYPVYIEAPFTHPKIDFVYFIQRKINTFIYIYSDISVIVVAFVLMII